MTKRKSYNLFKMWGSWISGIGIGGILLYISLQKYHGQATQWLNNILNIPSQISFLDKLIYFPLYILGRIGNFTNNTLIAYFSTIIITIIVGFIIGWGIHSLFRRLR